MRTANNEPLVKQHCIVVTPNFGFAKLANRLQELGWERAADPTLPDCIIAGEPDTAVWQRAETKNRIVYSFHPALFLRVLIVEGPQADSQARDLERHLPCLKAADARGLMAAQEVEAVLLGLHAASALNAVELLPDIAAVTSHPDPSIAGEAGDIYQRMVMACGNIGLRILSEWKARHPHRSALFLLAGGSSERCQLLRWMMRDQSSSNPHIDQVLATALEDGDWEVRVTAMLAAARLRAVHLRKAVAAVKLPEHTGEGINRDERRLLHSIQQCALEWLQGKPAPAADGPPDSRASMQAHIIRCMLGLPVAYCDHTFLFISALCNPLPAEYPLPETLPAGVMEDRGTYKLQYRDIPLVWVPAISHWLGEQLPRMYVENPIRQQTPPKGFFIGEGLFCEAGKQVPVICSQAEARQICETIGRESGLAVQLPSADEWEMAARGPDGRRFPWGNNARPDGNGNRRSPWGIRDAVGKLGQWTNTARGGDMFTVCGGKKQWVCAQRDVRPASSARTGFRILVESV